MAQSEIHAAGSPDVGRPLQLSTHQAVYLWLTAVNVACLLLANIVGVKLFRFELHAGGFTIPVEHTAGMLPFPLTFLLTDLVNEYYGPRNARRMTYVAFAMAGLAFAVLGAARALPTLEGIPGTATAEAFEMVFGAAALMYVASVLAYLLGSLLDIVLFSAFKRVTGGRLVWLRATGSTVVSQLFDSFAVTFFFFMAGPILLGREPAPASFVAQTALTGYVLKFVIAVAMTPVIYGGRAVLERGFGLRPIPAEGRGPRGL